MNKTTIRYKRQIKNLNTQINDWMEAYSDERDKHRQAQQTADYYKQQYERERQVSSALIEAVSNLVRLIK